MDEKLLDTRGLNCPLPVLKARKALMAMQPGQRLRVLTTDCWTAAWLRFARAPVVAQGRLFDLRFENAARGNFTAISDVEAAVNQDVRALSRAGACRGRTR